jgi:hypothetical protein
MRFGVDFLWIANPFPFQGLCNSDFSITPQLVVLRTWKPFTYSDIFYSKNPYILRNAGDI